MTDSYLPDRPPPRGESGLVAWLRRHLFSSPANTALTFCAIALIWLTVPPVISWAFIHADWAGQSAADCSRDGACWAFIRARFAQFLYGFYPADQRWRVNTLFFLILPAAMLLIWKSRGNTRFYLILANMLILPFLSWYMLRGGVFGLTPVATDKWGGMMLTLVVSSAGILFSLPFGILLALGRTSSMPVVRTICILFIELWRGVPLITVLFMANVMLPLFLPTGVHVDNLMRALIGVALFASAYMAEVVRGGLLAVPKGQYEAADSIGLNYVQKMRLIILPQALTSVIPAITNTYVGLLKDTTLVSIIGLYDFLGIVHSAAQDPQWLGFTLEGYAFCAAVYFLLCYGMSSTSYRLEKILAPEKR